MHGSRIHHRKNLKTFLLLVLTLSAGIATGKEVESEIKTGAVDLHRDISLGFENFIGDIDRFFGDAPRDGTVNKSWVRFRTELFDQTNQAAKTRASLKFKIVLPETEKRLHLLFSSEKDDNQGQTLSAVVTEPTSQKTGNISMGLRFLKNSRKNGGLKFDVGARVHDGKAQILSRLGTHFTRQLNDNWRFVLNNNAIYYSRSGFEDTLSLNVERYLDRSHKQLFLASTQLLWQEGNRGAHISEKLGWYEQVDDNLSLAVELVLNFQTSNSVEDHFRDGQFSFRLRQNIWQPWLFYEVEPSISWQAEEGYDTIYGGLFRVDVVFR